MVYINLKNPQNTKKPHQQENKQTIKPKTWEKNPTEKNVTWYEYHEDFIIRERQNRQKALQKIMFY